MLYLIFAEIEFLCPYVLGDRAVECEKTCMTLKYSESNLINLLSTLDHDQHKMKPNFKFPLRTR